MDTILSFDISSVCTGVSVFSEDNCIYYGNIKMAHKTHGERLLFFERQMIELVEAYKPNIICIEDIWAGNSIKTFKILAYYQGVAHKISHLYLDREPSVLTPSEVRKILGVKFNIKLNPTRKEKLETGVDSKRLTYNFIVEHFKLNNFEFKTHNDITDAIALGLAAQLVAGDENAGSIQDIRGKKGSKRRGDKEGVSQASKSISSRQKSRK